MTAELYIARQLSATIPAAFSIKVLCLK